MKLLANLMTAAVATLLWLSAVPLASGQPWTPQRTPDGQPDMQGMYTRNGVVDLEAQPPVNPIDPSGKNPLSVSNRGDGLGPYPKVFGEGGTVLRGGQRRQQRRVGIVDPPDKNLPWKPGEDARRREFLLHMNPAADLTHVELTRDARCRGFSRAKTATIRTNFCSGPDRW